MKYIRFTVRILFILVRILAYECVIKRSTTEKRRVFRGYLKARWYSPVWWILMIILLFLCIIDGGVIDWARSVKEEINCASSYVTIQQDIAKEYNLKIATYVVWRIYFLA